MRWRRDAEWINWSPPDTKDDIALVRVDKCVSCANEDWAFPRNSGAKMQIWMSSIPNGQRLSIYGWGTGSFHNQGNWALRTGKDKARITVQGSTAHHFWAKAKKARICRGDAGGPAVNEAGPNWNEHYLYGIASNFEYEPNDVCPSQDLKMRWNRVSFKMNEWIRARIENDGIDCQDLDRNGHPFLRCWPTPVIN